MDPLPESPLGPVVGDLENPAVRRYVRKPIAAKVMGKAEAGFGHLFFDSQDLSIGGAFLKADLMLEIGEELSLGRLAGLRCATRTDDDHELGHVAGFMRG